jgi:hypothetical protein
MTVEENKENHKDGNNWIYVHMEFRVIEVVGLSFID